MYTGLLRGLAGAGWHYMTPEIGPDHAAQIGAKGIYLGVTIDGFYPGSWVMPNGMSQYDFWIAAAKEIHRLGMYVHLQPTVWYAGGGSEACSVRQKALFVALMDNTAYTDPNSGHTVSNTMQDWYVTWMKTVVQELQPEVVNLFNEACADTTNGYYSSMSKYVTFINRLMSELNAVKPGIIYCVSGVPFWDLKTVSSLNFTVPAGCKLVYSYHYYYCFSTSTGPTVSPPGSWDPCLKYWNAITEAQFAQAKTDTYNYWLNTGGLQDVFNRGGEVLFEELGTDPRAQNFDRFIRDAYQFCIDHNMGWNALNSQQDGGLYSGIWYPGNFWNSDWTLNPIGQIWKQMVGSVTPPLTLPFHDDFVDLSKWQILKGDWIIR